MDKIQTGTSLIREFAKFIVILSKIQTSKYVNRPGTISSSTSVFWSTVADKLASKFVTMPLAISMIAVASSTERLPGGMIYNVMRRRKQMVRV